MKRFLNIFLLAVLSCCYINTVFEFSDKEKKANFENETHCYIHQDNHSATTFSTKTIPHFDIALNSPLQINFPADWINKKFSFFYQKYFSPPERLHLLHSVFLI